MNSVDTASVVKNSAVVLVQDVLPHYRVSLFQRLSAHPVLQCKLVCCKKSTNGLITTVQNPEIDIDIVRRIRFNTVSFQFLPRYVYTANVVILPANPRELSIFPIMIFRKLIGKKTILWGHGLSRRRESPLWIRRLRKLMAHITDAYIFYTEEGRKQFKALGIDEKKLFVARNSIDVEAIKAIENSNPQERTDILYIGTLRAAKKVQILIDAFARAKHQLPNKTKLIIVGDGPERSQLVKQAMHLKIEDIRFTGEVTDEHELATYLGSVKLAVFPGHMGLAGIHCVAHGVPILVSADAEHAPEIEILVPGVTGEFFSPATADALSTALINMFSKDEKLQELSKNGKQVVFEELSIDKMVEVFDSAYRFVMQ